MKIVCDRTGRFLAARFGASAFSFVIGFALLVPSIAAAQVTTNYWINPLGGKWKDAANWQDGAIPPDDGTRVVSFVGPANSAQMFDINLETSNRWVRGIFIQARSVYKYGGSYTFKTGKLSVGADGVQGDEEDSVTKFGGLRPVFDSTLTLELTASQTWIFRDTKCNWWPEIKSKLVAAEGIVLTLAGNNYYTIKDMNVDNFRGRIRVAASTGIITPLFTKTVPGGYELSNANAPTPLTGTAYAQFWSGGNYSGKMTAPIKFSLNEGTRICRLMGPGSSTGGNATSWNIEFAGPWSGTLSGDLFRLGIGSEYNSMNSIYPEKQRIILSGDNSGLSTNGMPRMWFEDFLMVVSNANSLATGNVLPVTLGTTGGGGNQDGRTPNSVGGLLAADGIVINSDINVTNTTTWSGMIVDLGAAYPDSAAVYNGKVVSVSKDKSRDKYIRLRAPAGSVATFNGDFSGTGLGLGYEVVADGDVILNGDNSGIGRGLGIRAGNLYLGSATAGGSVPMMLGSVVPTNLSVRAQLGVYNADDTYNNGVYKFKNTPITVNGVQLQVGDKVLANFNGNVQTVGTRNGIYEVTSVSNMTRIAALPQFKFGVRVYVEEGTTFAGRTFYQVSNGGTQGFYSEEPNPVIAAVYATNGLTVATDIVVGGFEGSGKRVIGTRDAGASATFSGGLLVSNSVTFAAAAGGAARFTGTVTDADAENKAAFGFAGTGTVELPAAAVGGRDLSWTADGGVATLAPSGSASISLSGRTVALDGLPDSLNPLQSYVLCNAGSATLSGDPEINLPQDFADDGWKVSVGSKTITLYRPNGLILFLR